jgi:hypothetical protein
MADLRINPGSNLPATQPAARTDAVKAAQRAFFNTALNQAQASQVVRRAEPPQTVAPVSVRTVSAATPADAAASPRVLRPGSFLDIKV